AVQNGYTGTIAQYLASLKGNEGKEGKPGEPRIKSLPEISNYNHDDLSSFYLQSLGQSGFFVKDNDTIIAANDGICFEDLKGNKYVRQYDTGINVDWFGAIANGIHDSTDAIQKAIDYAGWVGKCAVIFPKGEYLFTDVHITNPRVCIKGEGTLKGFVT